MATPQVCGVIALHLESDPTADRKKVRKWLFDTASIEMSDSDFYDPYQSNSATDTNYWGNSYSLKSSPRRILYNPYASDAKPKVSGVKMTGVSFSQS